MSKPVIAGIDYSMDSPAIVVWDSSKPFKHENLMYFCYAKATNKKNVFKYEGVHGPDKNIIITTQDLYKNEQERFNNIAKWAVAVMKLTNTTHPIIEDYAVNGKGRVYQIGENGGVLRHKMYFELGLEYEAVTATNLKKAFHGKGNALKIHMYEKHREQTGVDLVELTGYTYNKDLKNPPMGHVGDMCDAYALVTQHSLFNSLV